MEKKKMKLWKKILLVLGIVLIILIIMLLRKMFILKNLYDKVSSYEDYSNYYMKKTTYSGDSVTISKIYKKDNKSLITIENHNFEKNSKNAIKIYNDAETTNVYYETENNEKYVYLNQENFIKLNIPNILQTGDILELLTTSVTTRITSKNCNEKQCYALESLLPLYPAILYVEKDTGLTIRNSGTTGTVSSNGIATDEVHDYIYEFGTVKDNDIVMPDINDYKIMENKK